MNMKQSESKRVALVTGGGRGIGRAICLELAQRGNFVVVNCKSNTTEAENVLQEIRSIGGDGMVYQADVTDPKQVQTMFRTIQKQAAFVEVLVNNAGITRDSLMMRMTSSNWQQVVDTNLNAVYHCSKAASRTMAAKGRGVIVCIGSGSGLSPRAGQVNYSSTKSALLGFVRSLADAKRRNGDVLSSQRHRQTYAWRLLFPLRHPALHTVWDLWLPLEAWLFSAWGHAYND